MFPRFNLSNKIHFTWNQKMNSGSLIAFLIDISIKVKYLLLNARSNLYQMGSMSHRKIRLQRLDPCCQILENLNNIIHQWSLFNYQSMNISRSNDCFSPRPINQQTTLSKIVSWCYSLYRLVQESSFAVVLLRPLSMSPKK